MIYKVASEAAIDRLQCLIKLCVFLCYVRMKPFFFAKKPLNETWQDQAPKIVELLYFRPIFRVHFFPWKRSSDCVDCLEWLVPLQIFCSIILAWNFYFVLTFDPWIWILEQTASMELILGGFLCGHAAWLICILCVNHETTLVSSWGLPWSVCLVWRLKCLELYNE